jgi:GntR family transcriptional regulator/MocR family aminotransferase
VHVPLDRESATPLWRQLARWLGDHIEAGGLPDGTRLPSTRALAAELGVSRITVTTAYAALEADGQLVPREGSGTFVAARDRGERGDHEVAPEWPRWQRQLRPAPSARSSTERVRPAHADMISFTGVGDPRAFALGDFSATVREVLRQLGTSALAYGSFDRGHEPLRVTVARILASQGIRTSAEHVLITSGSQQGLSLVCQLLLSRGDAVIVELPTYDYALELFAELGLRVVGVPIDDEGMRVELVEAVLEHDRPRLIYTIPTFQNPSGTSMSGARRRTLLELAERNGVPIVEDDFAGDLRYEGRTQPAIKALDRSGTVIYIGTFSKLLQPGLRVGYAVANGPVLDRLAQIKRTHDLTTSPLMQLVVDRFVTLGRYQAHLRRTTRLYRQRRDAMLAALAERLPEATVSPVHGGLFAWVQLAEGVSTRRLLAAALERGVEYAPGDRYFADPVDGDRYLRLNFVTHPPADIDRGVARLAEAVRQHIP